MERAARLLAFRGFDVISAGVETFSDDRESGSGGCLLRFTVVETTSVSSPDWKDCLVEELSLLNHLDSQALELFYRLEDWRLVEVEVLYALVSLAHQKLLRIDSLRYSRERMLEACVRHSGESRRMSLVF